MRLSRMCQDSSHLSAHEGGLRHPTEADELHTKCPAGSSHGQDTRRPPPAMAQRFIKFYRHRKVPQNGFYEETEGTLPCEAAACPAQHSAQGSGRKSLQPYSACPGPGAVGQAKTWFSLSWGEEPQRTQGRRRTANGTTTSWQKVHWKHIPGATGFSGVSLTRTRCSDTTGTLSTAY